MKQRLVWCVCIVLVLAVTCCSVAFATEEGEPVYEASIINADGTVQTYYSSLAEALATAKSGNIVRLESDVTLTENLRVPTGVTLLLPCMDKDPGYVMRNNGKLAFNPDGTDSAGLIGPGPNAALYHSLTIPANKTMIVQGTVMVNAVTGRPSAGHYDMDVTGGYSQINLEGNIVIANNAKLDCFGYVKGNGTLRVTSGGTVGDLYIVRHWRGGTHGLAMFEEHVYPINEADCRNIEAELVVEDGATLDGLVKMYAGGTYNYTRFPQVDQSNGLIRLTSTNGEVVRTYANGREIYTISGGAEFSASTLTIVGVPLTSSDFPYPIDGDMDFILKDGDYSFVNDYKAMPGATMTVEGDATLTISDVPYLEDPVADTVYDDGIVTVVFYDKYDDLYAGPSSYPANQPAAQIILKDGATFTNKGAFGGTIVTNEDSVFVSEGVMPIWKGSTNETEEASVVANGTLGNRHVELTFGLQIHREGYVWTMDETDGSIVWHAIEEEQKDTADVQQTVTPQENTNLLVIEGMLFNTSGETIDTEYLLVALYDSADKLLSLGMKEVEKLYNGSAVTYRFSLKGAEGCSARVFVLGQGFVPALTK